MMIRLGFFRAWRRAFSLLVLMLLTSLWGPAAQAQTARAFSQRASFDEPGNIAMIGNVLLCNKSSNSAACPATQSGNNNSKQMYFVNVDNVAFTPANSSSATLSLPAGATVLYAGLYWGGRASTSDAGRNSVRMKVPGSSTYTTISSNQTDTITADYGVASAPYQAFANVTAQVQAAGSGNYFVGGVTTLTGSDSSLGYYGGWGLVVIYRDATQPLRRLSLYDGSVVIDGFGTNATVSVSGLLTPLSGTFKTYMGALVWEGEAGIAGDYFRLNSTDLSNAANPSDNFWNSTITNLGANITAKNPNIANQLGMDIDYTDASGILANGATSATLTFGSTNDVYYPQALTFAVDLHLPNLRESMKKNVTDVNGGVLLPGDILEYTVNFSNTGTDGATKVILTDPIPANTIYVPGSLQILTNASGGATGIQTDAAGDDRAEFDSANNRMVFRLGSGATTTAGGLIPATQSASVRFRVKLNENPFVSGNRTIANTATVAYGSQSVTTFSGTGTASVEITSAATASVVLRKASSIAPAGPFKFTLNNTYQTEGTVSTATANVAVQVDGDAAAGTQAFYVTSAGLGQSLTITESQSTNGWGLETASCSSGGSQVGSLAGNVYTIPAASVVSGATFTCDFTNTNKVDLSITKSNASSTVIAGATTVYTVIVTNKGPAAVQGAKVTDLPGGGISCPPANPVTCASTATPTACPATSITVADLLASAPNGGLLLGHLPAADGSNTVTLTYTCDIAP